MAYSTGTYTNLSNALTQFIAWGVSNGWVNNSPATGEQLYKSIDGVDCYLNLNTQASGSPFPAYAGDVTNALAVTGSTGFDAGEDWNAQPGVPLHEGDITGGVVDELFPTGGDYHFFATPTTLSVAFETDSHQGDWRFLTIGNTGGMPFYAASGGRYVYSNDDYDRRSAFLSQSTSSTLVDDHSGANAFYTGTTWLLVQYYTYSTLGTRPLFVVDGRYPNGHTGSPPKGSLAAQLLKHSPDAFRGNQILAPSQVMGNPVSSDPWVIGEVGGVKFTNMKNIPDGFEVSDGAGGTYKCFRILQASNIGVCFLK